MHDKAAENKPRDRMYAACFFPGHLFLQARCSLSYFSARTDLPIAMQQHAWQWKMDEEVVLNAVDTNEFHRHYQHREWRHSLVYLPAKESDQEFLQVGPQQMLVSFWG